METHARPWIPDSDVGDMDGVPGAWLLVGPVLAVVVTLGSESVCESSLFLSLSLLTLPLFLSKKSGNKHIISNRCQV